MRQKGIAHLFLLLVVIVVAIGAIGYLAYQNAQLKKQAEDTTTPETTDQQITELTESPETANWKTFTDSGFSFKYPNEWTLNEQGKNGNLFSSALTLIDPSNGNKTGFGSIIIFVYDNPNKLSLKEYEEQEVEKYGNEAQRLVFYRTSGINTSLGDSSAMLLPDENCEPGKCDIYLLSINENIYQILVRYDFVNKSTIGKILSTFKFLDETSIDKGNNYVFDKYSFSAPEEFKLEKQDTTGDHRSIIFISDSGIQFELAVNEGGRSIQCFENVEETTRTIYNNNFKQVIFKGTGPTELFPHCNNASKYVVWIILDEYKPPQEGIKDMIWYSFDTNQVGYDKAMGLLDKFITSFKFL